MIDNPHFALPFCFERGFAQQNEQDSLEDIAACVEAILRTEPGDRLDNPHFGTPDQTFSTARDPDHIQILLRDIERWEPRASILIDEGWDFDTFTEQIRIQMSKRGGEVG